MRRRAHDPLDRLLIAPARLIAGYGAAVSSWQLLMEWAGHSPDPEPRAHAWALLCLVTTGIWLGARRRTRLALRRRDRAGTPPSRPPPPRDPA